MAGVGLVWDLLAVDHASPAFLKVAGAADKAAASTAKATSGLAASLDKVSAAGATLTKKVTLPLAAMGAVAVDQAVKWQKSMTLIQTAGGETASKAAALSKGLLTVAQQTGTSLTALSEGIYTVAKAGSQKWSATDQLIIMKAAAEGAKAENVDLGTATNALTSVMMSYHLGASKAVATENELIVGAGRAKTTMQEYASSLSAVVPVASAAGISFAQVAGAIATLTQHGTSAQEATQELAFTIRNLQAPNNVAIAAMNQLGISSVNVAKNLGTRGLSGTLQFIEQHLPKSGLVYLDAMKKMESGTADLDQMLGKMSPHLAGLSKQFLDGSLGFTDYRKAFRGLGAEGSAQGAQFVTLAQKVMGYNDQLKLGTPAQKTMASQLKQIFGGAVGLNTALQLGGENMAYFKSATEQVGKAALDTGSDVLGWNKTQDTLAVKMDKAKASLQVLAVEIGTALIPAVSKIVGWVQKAVDWFESLSGTDKKILGWSVGVIAALGPILSIGSRLVLVGRGVGMFVSGASSQLASLAGATESQATRIGVAMSRVTAALSGVGIGIATGELTKHSSTTTKLLGALGAAGTGAAIGAGFGGPWGAAIGGLAGGLSSLATSFLSVGNSAKSSGVVAAAALAAQKQSADALLQTLQSVGGAYDSTTQAQVITQLDQRGALGIASHAGLSLTTVAAAAGGTLSLKQLAALNVQIENAAASGKITFKQMGQLQSAIGGVSAAALQAEKSYELQNAAAGKGVLTNDQLGTSLAKLRAAFAGTGTLLDGATMGGLRNTAAVEQESAAIGKNAALQLKHGKSVDSVAKSVETQTLALQANLVKMGFNSAAVADLIVKYAHVPKSVATKMATNAPYVSSLIAALVRQYAALPYRKTLTIYADTSQATSAVLALQNQLRGMGAHISLTNLKYGGYASGTNGRGLPEGVSAVGDGGGPELAIKRGPHVEILSTSQSRAFLAATGMRAPGFAGGTSPSRVSSAPVETSELRLLIDALADVATEFGRVAQRPIDLDGKPFRAMADDRLEAALRKLTTVKKHGRKG